MIDPIHKAVIHTLEHGGPDVTYQVPEGAAIRLEDRYDGSHLLAGATITAWSDE